VRFSPLRPAAGLLLVAAVGLAGLGKQADPPATGPNVIVIMTDDMRLDDLKYMPNTLHLLADQGVTFRQMLSPYPLCCPARAELLSGQYSHNNGVQGNAWPRGGYYKLDSLNTLPVWLQDGGYETAFLGKYLNEYGYRDPYEVPAGWDYWFGSVSGISGIYDYHWVTTNEGGRVVTHPRVYQTDLFDSRTTDLVNLYADSDRPYFLWSSYIAPHNECVRRTAPQDRSCWGAPTPDYGDVGTFDDLVIHDDASINEADMSDKGAFMQALPSLSHQRLVGQHRLRIRRIESLQSVDRAVVHLVDELRATGQYDNTYLIFTSDNGVQLGEHRWRGKILGYEPSVRVPLIISGPGLPHGVVRDQAVTMVDLAATVADLADVTPRRRLDGESLLPLARGDVPDGRDRVVPLEAGPRDNITAGWFYRGVRTDRYTLIVWRNGDTELYDRRRDPLQLDSVASSPAYADVQQHLEQRLLQLKNCKGDGCMQWYHVPVS